jgi:hypothetical protein
MAKKMKKFFGDKNWYETLYRWTMDEEDIEWRKEQGEKINLRGGDTEFFLLAPPFHDSDINSAIMFEPWHSGGWDDTNLFIVDTEEFNWYKKRRI